jgi:uncharacterized protein involved in exopolysaccharide biosynthesis
MVDSHYTAKDYLHAFRRRARLFLGVAAFVFSIAVAFALLPSDVYRASAELRIDLEGPNVELLEPMVMTTYADQYVKTLQQKVMTYDNLGRWLDESNPYSHEGDDLARGQSIRNLEEDIAIQMVFTTVFDEARGADVDLITGFTTAFAARDPEIAATIANNVASAFLAEDRATRMESAATAASFLREQIDAKREEIVEIEARIATFKEQNAGKLPELMVLNMTTLERSERELENVEREMRTLQQDRFFRDAQLQEIRQRVGGTGVNLAALEAEYYRAISTYGPDHPDVIRIRRQVAGLTAGVAAADGGSPEIVQVQIDLAAAQERYSDEHPDVIRLKRRLQELQAGGPFGSGNENVDDPLYLQLRAQVNAIDSNLEGLRARAAELRTQRAQLQDRLATMPQVERQYQVLERELQTATLAFDGLRQRMAQAQQIESFEAGERGARLQQVREARPPPAPTGPPRLAITILGLFVAAIFGGTAAFAREISDNTVRGSADVRTILDVQPIVAIPVVRNSTTRAEMRRRMLMLTFNTAMLAAIIVLVVSVITG